MPGVHAVLTHEDVPGRKVYGLEIPDQPVLAWDAGALPGRAGRAGRRRPSGDRPPRALERSTSSTRCSTRSPTPSTRSTRRGAAPAHVAATPCATRRCATATGGRGRRRRHRRVRGRHAGPGLPRPGVRARGARRRRRRRPLHRHPVAARRPRPARRVPRPAAREGAADPGRRRRRVRRPRGPLDAGPRLPARPAHRPAGEDRLRPRGVVLRPRAPPPGPDALRARRHPRRQARLRPGRIVLDGGAYASSSTAVVLERRVASPAGRTTCRTRRSTRTASTPTTRPAARCAASARCRPASPTSRRWTSWPRRSAWTRSSCGCATRWRQGTRCPPARWSTRRRRWRELLERLRDMPLPPPAPDAAARPARAARRRLEHHPRRGRRARRRLRRRDQEHRLLRGLRRLLHRPGAAGRVDDGEPLVRVHTAAAEVGQGLVTVQAQIARTELGVEQVAVLPADTLGRLGRLDARPRARRT